MKDDCTNINLNQLRLVLASQSPRRKELLSYLQVPFEIRPSSIDEVVDSKLFPADVAKDLACQKAKEVFFQKKKNNEVVIGADTIVVLDNTILGKPRDREQGESFLNKLSSRTHEVFTGVSIITNKKEFSFVESTQVTFGSISRGLMKSYLDSGDYLDKAGGYGIQGMGLSFIKEIKGSYSNVVGFPLYEFYNHLLPFLNLNESNWKEYFE